MRVPRGHGMVGLVVLTLCGVWSYTAHPADTLEVGAFSTLQPGAQLTQWQPLTFKKIERKTRYELVQDEGTTVVKAQAQASASGLVRHMQIDLKQFPLLQWRWKVANTLRNSDPAKKSGDDYPARIYVTFKYDPAKLSLGQRAKYATAKMFYGDYPPHAAINYVWDSKTPPGSVLPNAYTDRVKMIVVESGAARLNQWLSEQRNVYQDYQRAFGEEPPPISGVAIMTDTDNTAETATAYYGDLRFAAQ